jgi:uncharacterized delta-60 repeat protein
MWFFTPRQRRSAAPARRPLSHRPRLEMLEDRCVPSTAGFLDTSFGAPNGYVVTTVNSRQSGGNAIAVQSDGKTVVAGRAADARGNSSLALLRYNSDGSLDSTFGNGGIVLTTLVKGVNTGASGYSAVAILSDGKIVVAGSQLLSNTPINFQYDWEWVLARYNPDGTLDTTFGGGRHPSGIAQYNLTSGREVVSAMQIQPWDGKIVVVGSTVGSGDDVAVGRFNIDGTSDTTFGSGGFVTWTSPGAASDNATDVALQSDHKIVVVGGTTANSGATVQLVMLRYNSNGSLDTTFNGSGVVDSGFFGAHGVAIQSDGSIVVAGGVPASGSTPAQAELARFTSTGAVDTTFGSNGTAVINGMTGASDLLLDPNTAGEFDVCGGFQTGSGSSTTYSDAVARVQANGSLDTGFGANAGVSSYLAPYGNNNSPDNFSRLALDSHGNIVTTGDVYFSSGIPRTIVVARYYGATTAAAALASSARSLDVTSSAADSHVIDTTGSGQLTSLTATGGTTVGVIDTGILRGTTQFSAQFTDAQGDYVGTLVITTPQGTLTLLDVGHLNFATGEFSDHETVLSGTGHFAGATGFLDFHGFVNLQTGTFVDDSIKGVIQLMPAAS